MLELSHLHPTRFRHHFAVLLLLVPAIVFALILLVFLFQRGGQKAEINLDSGFVGQKQEVSQSKWATDSNVTKFEEELKILQEKMQNIKLEEPELTFPLLDFGVGF